MKVPWKGKTDWQRQQRSSPQFSRFRLVCAAQVMSRLPIQSTCAPQHQLLRLAPGQFPEAIHGIDCSVILH
jgi:hypothetical protein